LQNGHNLDIRPQGNRVSDSQPHGVSDAWPDADNSLLDIRSYTTLLQEIGYTESDTSANRCSYRGNSSADTYTRADAFSFGVTKTIISPIALSNNGDADDFAHYFITDITSTDEISNARADEKSDETSNRIANQTTYPKPNNASPDPKPNNEVPN
jgi:hypothetical protein